MRCNSRYESYRDRLSILTNSSWSTKIIDRAVQRWPEWQNYAVWQRSYGRFIPGGSPFASLLYRPVDCPNDMCLIEIFDERPAGNLDVIQYFDDTLGWLQLRKFPNDPHLPKLYDVLERGEKLTVLRYRPYKRCTFKISPDNFSGPIFGKMFYDQRGAVIHEESKALWHAANRGELKFAVAEPIKFDQSTGTLWQHAVAGNAVIDQLFDRHGGRLAERIGHAVASITKSNLQPTLKFDGVDQFKRTFKYVDEICQQLPDLANPLNHIVITLEKNHRSVPQRPSKPLHGAPHLHQWLVSEFGLGLVDFDRICMGDPELDAATFIAEIDFEDAEKVPVPEIIDSFLEGYQSIAGSLNLCLLQTYRCHKRLAKALKALRSININGDQKARRHVAYAAQAVNLKCV